MSNTKKKQWHSLGDFLQAKEERERAQSEDKPAESKGDDLTTGVGTGVPTGVSTPVATGVAARSHEKPSAALLEPALPETSTEPESKDKQPYLDATHTASEQRIYSVMYRETVSKGQRERHFGFKELCGKTGIRSDRTIRLALDGLQEKLSVEIVSYSHGNPLGPRYRVYDPKEIHKRRKAAGIEIDPQSKQITSTPVPTGVGTGVCTGVPTGGKKYGSTPVETTPVTPVDSTGVYKYRNSSGGESYSGEASSSNQYRRGDDDEAFAEFVSLLREHAREITGKEPSANEAGRWRELAEVLVTELRIAAGRTTVSSVPAFLAEHLKRRLWKIENLKQPIPAAEGAEASEPGGLRDEARECPDCWGTGMFYPGGFEKGVARCKHERLRPSFDAHEDAQATE
ncbi:MAG TPA: hypothetical protein VER08_02840 [Pyrinomonadaceae bacterium]|nr:hypothetical protein [Pyrinomonadaceae bacterium]